MLSLCIIYDVQNLPVKFFRDVSAFINLAFDSRDLMAVWLLTFPWVIPCSGVPCAALASRIQVHLRLQPITDREHLNQLVTHTFSQIGAQHALLSDSGLSCCVRRLRACPSKQDAFARSASS